MTIQIWDIISQYLEVEDKKEFAKWAFGKNIFHAIYGPQDIVRKWNKRHKVYLEMKIDKKANEYIPKMIDIWIRHRLDRNIHERN